MSAPRTPTQGRRSSRADGQAHAGNQPVTCIGHAYQKLGIAAERFDTARNLHRALQKQPPDFFVGEFIYGWGNNYAGANVSNLDASGPCNALRRRRRSSCSCIPVTYPVSEQTMQAALQTPA
jgi:hypothetical protein